MTEYTYIDKVSGRTLYVREETTDINGAIGHRTFGLKVLRTFSKDPGYRIFHREDGPAVEYTDGEEHWFQNNRYHRLDGPAVVRPSADRKEWWVDDVRIHHNLLMQKQKHL